MNSVIYQPKGAALEYSPLACNIWLTCSHGCRYCYGPACLRKQPSEFFTEATARKDILHNIEKDCQKIPGERRPILLSFVCDVYQPHDQRSAITRQALEILERYHMKAQVLTKGGMRAERDFDILKRNKWKFGTSLSWSYWREASEYEPGAAVIASRIEAIQIAHHMGIFTWVSLEPVIDPDQALDAIRLLKNHVDFWKVGKLNHHSELEAKVDWSKFLKDVRLLLKDRPHYIKTDLLAWEKP